MKKYQRFEFALLLLVVFLGFSVSLAQKKTNVKKKSASPTLKDTLEFIQGNMKSPISYLDDKENVSCPNQIAKKLSYEQVAFSEPNLEIKIKDDVTRSVCSTNLTGDKKTSSKSITNDENRVLIPLRELDSAAIKSGSCPIDGGYQRKEGSCFFVSLETLYGKKAISIEKTNSFWFDDKQMSDKKTVSFTTNQFQMYFTDEETANNIAKAFAQAIKMSGGKN